MVAQGQLGGQAPLGPPGSRGMKQGLWLAWVGEGDDRQLADHKSKPQDLRKQRTTSCLILNKKRLKTLPVRPTCRCETWLPTQAARLGPHARGPSKFSLTPLASRHLSAELIGPCGVSWHFVQTLLPVLCHIIFYLVALALDFLIIISWGLLLCQALGPVLDGPELISSSHSHGWSH